MSCFQLCGSSLLVYLWPARSLPPKWREEILTRLRSPRVGPASYLLFLILFQIFQSKAAAACCCAAKDEGVEVTAYAIGVADGPQPACSS